MILAHNIAVTEIRAVLLALVAFIPVALFPGYLFSWFVDLYHFRSRSLVERMLWSVPTSLAVSTIGSVLVAWVFSLTVVEWIFAFGAALWLGLLVWEWMQARRTGVRMIIGLQPLGGAAIIWAVLWIAVSVMSLIDYDYHRQLFTSLTIYDQAARVSWTESVLRTGVPPANPFYWYQHASPMRNYYFWYVLCAVVARLAHVSARAALMASGVWSGFGLAALIGLYLKHFLRVSNQLRRQFTVAISLLTVCGLDIIVHIWNYHYLRIPIFSHRWAWFVGQIDSWFVTLLFAPHHIASLVCCMFAFLLAWLAKNSESKRIAAIVLIAFAFSSAFGLSLYVTFAFFLLMLAWGLWQLISERNYQASLMLAIGGCGSVLLLVPYLRQLTASESGMHGSSPFGFAVRETIPPDWMLSLQLFRHIAALSHPETTRNLAKLLLLIPGLCEELGFFFGVFLLYLVASFRNHTKFSRAQRTLIFISSASLLISSFVRSSVISYNDFGFRSALFAEFCLLLLASEVVVGWQSRDGVLEVAGEESGAPPSSPSWARALVAVACIFGVLTTAYYAVMFRFTVPLVEAAHKQLVRDPIQGNLSHDAYISEIGYQKLDRLIPRSAVVQFNPSLPNEFWGLANLVVVDRQVAIAGDKPWCGAELGGDPSGCLIMGPPIAGLFKDASADQVRSVCHQFGIEYLVTTIYDPVWTDRNSWVWTLTPVVQDPEFRALDCRK